MFIRWLDCFVTRLVFCLLLGLFDVEVVGISLVVLFALNYVYLVCGGLCVCLLFAGADLRVAGFICWLVLLIWVGLLLDY